MTEQQRNTILSRWRAGAPQRRPRSDGDRDVAPAGDLECDDRLAAGWRVLQCETDASGAASGMTMHIGQRFLHDAEERGLDPDQQAPISQLRRDLKRYSYAAAL